jgi:hypothetical protein
MRIESSNDFPVVVEGVGTFMFGYRKLADELRIQVEYARITEGVQATVWLFNLATYLSALRVLMVKAPNGWDLEELDPLDEETFIQIERVFAGLRAKEDSFRPKRAKAGEAPSKGNVPDDGLLVPAEVQPPAE